MANIILNGSNLTSALDRCSSIVQNNPTPIVLKYCRLRFVKKDDLLYVQSTDGKIQVSHSLHILSSDLFDEDFDILIDPKIAVASLPAIKSDEVELECNVEKSEVTIKGGKTKFTLLSQPSSDFPKFAFSNVSTGYKLPSGILKKMLSSALSAINKDESKAVLTTACIEYVVNKESEFRRNSIHIVGANGQTLIYSNYECDLGDNEFQILIPNEVIMAICRVLEDTDDVEIKYLKDGDVLKSMFFETRKAEIGCSTIGADYKYPDWEKLIPGGVKKITNEHVCKIAIPLEAFREAVGYAQNLSDKEFRQIDILYNFRENDIGYIAVTAQSEIGRAEIEPIEVKVIVNGEGSFDIKLCGTFLNNVLNSIHGNDIILTKSIDPTRKIQVMRLDSGSVKSDVNIGGIVAPIKKVDKKES
jgi:DNA polymerase III sliding clamp (beta) subunit (PCNA family)